MRILTVVGARPQFIKAAPVSRVLRQHHEEFLLHTGQHYDDEMSDLFFRQLGIPAPAANLGVGSGSHAAQTAAMLHGIERFAEEFDPDWILIYGDTNSTLAGALVGAKLRIRVAHVEAGLRSFDRSMPEEVNRVVADHVSTLLLCPTPRAAANLRREGIVDGVGVVGDVMLDAFNEHLGIARRRGPVVADFGLDGAKYHLLTVHRAANVDDPDRLAAIISGVSQVGDHVLFPAHPRTRRALRSLGIRPEWNLHLIDPVGYLEMLVLEDNAETIVTDSGGVQKEAYFAGKPCITLRDRTEWTETVDAGWNLLVGTEPDRIVEAMREFRPTGDRPDLFGDGAAATRVVDALSEPGRASK